MFPVDLNFSITYSGNINQSQLIDEIKKYVDDNQRDTFSVRAMIDYLYTNKIVNSVNEPISISYSRLNDELEIETGSFTDTIQIRIIDFFRVKDVVVNKI